MKLLPLSSPAFPVFVLLSSAHQIHYNGPRPCSYIECVRSAQNYHSNISVNMLIKLCLGFARTLSINVYDGTFLTPRSQIPNCRLFPYNGGFRFLT